MRAGRRTSARGDSGFSLIELMVAMGLTLIVMVIAAKFLAQSFNVRAREDRRSDAIADVQRAINIMGREIANSGYRLPADLKYTPPGGTATAVPVNGLLPAYSDGDSIAFVANLNAQAGAVGTTNNYVNETDEAVLFTLSTNAAANPAQSFLSRMDMSTGNVMVLANRIDSLTITYFDRDPATGALSALPANSAPTANTTKVRIAVTVTLPAVGTSGKEGYQKLFRTQLQTEVALRNANLSGY
ncbi:MAG TPA: prepilin-type N-terminal cleavage/methylation domain-containing protein [Pyrinomonadaceae bacterium]|nr:prepilin-type N-terminal cleavage/methylation domain-containing protein [Pyrinomonadaceae bacterium]